MRFKRFLVEDSISSALSLDEPEVGRKYGTSAVKRKLEMIQSAINTLSKKQQTDATEAQMADLEDKLDKWQNVDSETEPADTQDTRQGVAEPDAPAEEEPAAEEEPEPEPEEEPEKEEPNPKKKKKKEDVQENRLIKSKIKLK